MNSKRMPNSYIYLPVITVNAIIKNAKQGSKNVYSSTRNKKTGSFFKMRLATNQ